jgi:predicted oxidoreductase
MEMNPLRREKIIQGLMRIEKLSDEELYNLIVFDLKKGIHFFDISDVYGENECERKLGRVLLAHPELREQMIIQTKCGIVKNAKENIRYFDLSYDHIVSSCLASIKRMNIDHIDYFLLHRPDIFTEASEVAKAMATLLEDGKALHFGVSNFPHEMIKYIRDHTNIPLEINQLQLGLGHLDLVREVLNCNLNNEEGTEHTGELFFYMKRYNITLQCRSPYQYGFFGGVIFDDPKYAKLNETLEEIAEKHSTSKCAIATAFILKLGEDVQVITGSTNPKHIAESLAGTKVKLTKEERYRLYASTGNLLP